MGNVMNIHTVSPRPLLFPYLQYGSTVKFLNFGTPENFAVIYLKFKQRGQTLRVFCQNGVNEIANSKDPDLGAV